VKRNSRKTLGVGDQSKQVKHKEETKNENQRIQKMGWKNAECSFLDKTRALEMGV